MDHPTPSWLTFADRVRKGRVPVRDANDAVVAEIVTSWTGTSFRAFDAEGGPLCSGTATWLGMSGRWEVTDGVGEPLLTLRKSPWRAQAELELARGGTFRVRGSTWRRGFAVLDAAGDVVLAAVPQSSALSFRAYAFGVQQTGGRLTLAEVVALVQVWRLLRKNEDAAAAGGAVAAVSG